MGKTYSPVSSGLLAASAAVDEAAAELYGVTLVTDGTNAASVILYDHASAASGTELANLNAAATSSAVHASFNPPVAASNGIYAELAANSSCIVYSRLKK